MEIPQEFINKVKALGGNVKLHVDTKGYQNLNKNFVYVDVQFFDESITTIPKFLFEDKLVKIGDLEFVDKTDITDISEYVECLHLSISGKGSFSKLPDRDISGKIKSLYIQNNKIKEVPKNFKSVDTQIYGDNEIDTTDVDDCYNHFGAYEILSSTDSKLWSIIMEVFDVIKKSKSPIVISTKTCIPHYKGHIQPFLSLETKKKLLEHIKKVIDTK